MQMDKKDLADRIFDFHDAFTEYSLRNPDVLDRIPDRAILVFLDAEDSAFNEKNKKLCRESRRLQEKAGEIAGPLVYITMTRAREGKAATVISVKTEDEI